MGRPAAYTEIPTLAAGQRSRIDAWDLARKVIGIVPGPLTSRFSYCIKWQRTYPIRYFICLPLLGLQDHLAGRS